MTKVGSVCLVVGINRGTARRSLSLARNVRLGSDGKRSLLFISQKKTSTKRAANLKNHCNLPSTDAIRLPLRVLICWACKGAVATVTRMITVRIIMLSVVANSFKLGRKEKRKKAVSHL